MAYGREEVQVHTLLTLCSCTLCHQTISWSLFAVLTFLFCHKISLAIKTGYSFTHYISWNPYFHGLLVFSITYPHSLALYECDVVSLTLHLHYPWRKLLSANWTGGWMGQRFGLEALKKWKIFWPCQEPNLNYSFIHPGHRLPTTTTALSQLPFYSQSYPEYMCYSCNRLSVQQPHLISQEINQEYENGLQ